MEGKLITRFKDGWRAQKKQEWGELRRQMKPGGDERRAYDGWGVQIKPV